MMNELIFNRDVSISLLKEILIMLAFKIILAKLKKSQINKIVLKMKILGGKVCILKN